MNLDKIKLQTTWNDAAASINRNFDKLKQVFVEGGGGAGLQYSVERTMYMTEYRILDYKETFEITEEQRAYNIQTYEMVWDDQPVVLSFGGFFTLVSAGDGGDGLGYATFNNIVEVGEGFIFGGLMSQTVTVYSNGDVIMDIKEVQTGSTPRVTDFSSDFNNDF